MDRIEIRTKPRVKVAQVAFARVRLEPVQYLVQQ
jgi:hypothetical protein